MESSPHKIIGEGSYGCVAKPSLMCQGSTRRNYKNKVSKIMLSKYADLEYNEMKAITKINGIDKYIVSLPELCRPVTDDNFKTTLKYCENKKLLKAIDSDFRLLVYEDGGVSLNQFARDLLPSLTENDINIFLTRIHHLLEGLCFLHENDIVHHDIKSRNIVYNIETNVIKFIDFGLVKRRSQLIQESETSTNSMAQEWDNFPPEYEFANRNEYAFYKMPYDQFIERLAYTFDAYSFGRMLKELLVKIVPFSGKNYEGITELFVLADKMADKNIETRDYDIFKLPGEYKRILKKYGIWNPNKGQPSKESLHIQKKIGKIIDMSADEILSFKKALMKPCGAMKERNPKTKRCVKKCRNGYHRNDKFQCKKKKRKTRKLESI
jgi:serine/threonine protein kinase